MVSKLRDRPTADLVVIFLAGIVGVSTLVGMSGLMYAAIFTDHDVSNLALRLSGILNTLAGAVVGYVAGRGTGVEVGVNLSNGKGDTSQQQSHSRGDQTPKHRNGT